MANAIFSGLGRRADRARDQAEDYGRRAVDTVRDRSGDAQGELRRLWSQLEDLVGNRVAPAASDAVRAAGGYAEEGRDMAMDLAQQVRSAARARPLLAIGIAVAATWLVLSLFGRRR